MHEHKNISVVNLWIMNCALSLSLSSVSLHCVQGLSSSLSLRGAIPTAAASGVLAGQCPRATSPPDTLLHSSPNPAQ